MKHCVRTPGAVLASRRSGGASDPLADHVGYLRAYALGRRMTLPDAEDAVQDTLLAAMEARAPFGERAAYRTWLTAILRHKMLDHYRRTDVRRGVSLDDRDEDGLTLAERLPAAETEETDPKTLEQARGCIARGLRRLPADQRDAWLLTQHHELPAATVARLMGKSVDHVWVLSHRAKVKLTRLLAAEMAPT